jgi:hypothetical protein
MWNNIQSNEKIMISFFAKFLMIRKHDDCNCNSSNPLNTLAKYKENKTAEKDIFC